MLTTRSIIRPIFLIPALILGLGSGSAQTVKARASFAIAPHKIYPVLRNLAERGGWEKLVEGVKDLEPVISDIDRTLELDLAEDLKRALETRNKEDSILGLDRMMGARIEVLLIRTREIKDPLQVREAIRRAFTAYLSMERHFIRKRFKTCQRIKTLFRRCYGLAVVDPEQYEAVCERIIGLLRELTGQAKADKG